MEYTAPHTPQHNGVVERRFVTDRNRAMAMMTAANFSEETKDLLRCEAINTASKLGDILVRNGKTKSAFEDFYGHSSPLIPYLVEFGRIGYATKREQIQKKWSTASGGGGEFGALDAHFTPTKHLLTQSGCPMGGRQVWP